MSVIRGREGGGKRNPENSILEILGAHGLRLPRGKWVVGGVRGEA